MDLADEISAGFTEGAKPLASDYLLTNEPHRGVITGTGGKAFAREPGIESCDGITIVEPVANFTCPPSPEQREIVEIVAGQFAGKWVLVSCTADNAHYTMACEASE